MARRGRVRHIGRQGVVGVDVIGLDEVKAAIEALGPAIRDKLVRRGLREGADVILYEQARYVPIAERGTPNHPPGTLFRSLQTFPIRRGKTRSVTFVGANADGWYGRLIEYGYRARDGSQVPARPWLRPALHAAFGPTVAEFKDTVRDGLDEVVRDVAQHEGSR